MLIYYYSDTDLFFESSLTYLELPSRAKYIKGDGEELVVNKSTVNRKYSHDQEQVATIEAGLNHLVQFGFTQRFLLQHQEQCKEEHQETMSHIPKHDTKHERETDDRVGS